MAATKAKKRYRTPGVVNGSLAYDFNTLERQLDRTGRMTPDLYTAPMEEHAADVIARAHEKTKAQIRQADALAPAMVAAFVLVAAMMVLMVTCYVELSVISNSVVDKRAQVTALQTEQVLLTTKHEQAFDLATVKEAALAAGMSLPSESQIYNIDLSIPDNAVVYQSETRGVAGVLDTVKEWVGKAVEYFR